MDLNLVRIFVAIYETRSLTKAAQRLYVTQSAVIQQLARLRLTLDDHLFQRNGRVMQPTIVAKNLYPAFRDAVIGVDTVVGKITAFDPLTETRSFRIALSELGEVGWFANIVSEVHADAPHVQLHSVDLQPEQMEHWLTSGFVDIAISSQNLPEAFQRTPIKEQTYSAVMSHHHPLADRSLTPADYAEASRVLVAGESGLDEIFASERRADIFSDPGIIIQRYATLMPLLEQHSTLLSVIPTTLAYGWAKSTPLSSRNSPSQWNQSAYLCICVRMHMTCLG